MSLLKRIKNNKGESIAETLIALLISSLALTMFAMAISFSTRIVLTGKRKLAAYYDANESMIKMSSTVKTGNISFTNFSENPLSITPISVNYYENSVFDNTKVIVYKKVK